MPRSILAVAVKLAIASLIVGLVLSWLELGPREIYRMLGESARTLLDRALHWLTWAWEYILMGALVVVPLWLLWQGLKRLRRG